jgi:hypothetical protein
MPLVKRATGWMKQTYHAGAGKMTSKGITHAASGASSGARSFAKNSRMAQYAMKHPGRAGAMGLGAASLGGYAMKGRRGRGTDKFAGGRPTGMYGR